MWRRLGRPRRPGHGRDVLRPRVRCPVGAADGRRASAEVAVTQRRSLHDRAPYYYNESLPERRPGRHLSLRRRKASGARAATKTAAATTTTTGDRRGVVDARGTAPRRARRGAAQARAAAVAARVAAQVLARAHVPKMERRVSPQVIARAASTNYEGTARPPVEHGARLPRARASYADGAARAPPVPPPPLPASPPARRPSPPKLPVTRTSLDTTSSKNRTMTPSRYQPGYRARPRL